MRKPVISTKGYSKEEQESVCTYDVLNDEWVFYTTCRKHITKLLKTYKDVSNAKIEVLEEYANGTPVAIQVTVQGDLVTFRKPTSKAKREKLREQAKGRFDK